MSTSVCADCWDEAKTTGGPLPTALKSKDVWQMRVEFKNLGDQRSRIAVVNLKDLCRPHAQARADRLQRKDVTAVQEAFL